MTSRPQLRGRAARLARLLPAGPSHAARTPFVLLVVVLLAGGLITLLILNSSLNEGSFRLDDLRKRTTDLTDEEQELQREVNGYADPEALQRRAQKLGMVPGGDPAFLGPDGSVRGVPEAASTPPAPPSDPAPTSSPTPSVTPSAPVSGDLTPSGQQTGTTPQRWP